VDWPVCTYPKSTKCYTA